MKLHSPRVIISGGGTGGHIFPAIAIADAIKKLNSKAEILFVGALGKMEMKKVPEAGYRIEGLNIAGIQRKLTLKNLLVPFKLLQSLFKARGIIKRFSPHVAVGVGGYASGPLLRVAAQKGIPTVIQEQNSYPGITNRILAKKAKKICVAFDGMEKFFPKDKLVLTGNPVRSVVIDLSGKKERAQKHFGLDPTKKTILIVGGSLGARTLNESVQNSFEKIRASGVQVIWQTGTYYYNSAKEKADQFACENIKVHEFLRDMDLAYAAADLTISRAGAMSISELSLVKMPAILVPSPNVSEDHQTKNAMNLVNKGAAELVKDNEAKETLIEKAIALVNDFKKLEQMAENTASVAKANAAEKIAKEIFELIVE
ncbi:MAG: undecaprenyldiphospho-muramoylpentapeptide beta-N-acetylglucosaminyltransferase [Flavobacteriales bacterium]|nr:undecaprenyldiphospho-muramoylpentapeptide beta-N-acetylglucosaminyltransferase [Flavobacteriales bacterium]